MAIIIINRIYNIFCSNYRTIESNYGLLNTIECILSLDSLRKARRGVLLLSVFIGQDLEP